MDSFLRDPKCKNLAVRPCNKLKKEKLCSVYTTKDNKKKCRKYRNARPLTAEDVLRTRPVSRVARQTPVNEPVPPVEIGSIVNPRVKSAPKSAPKSAQNYQPPPYKSPEEQKYEEPLIEHEKPIKRKLIRKIPTTLERIQVVYGGIEGENIAQDIDELEMDTNRAVLNLIKNTSFRNRLEQELTGVADKTDYVERYVRLRSKAVKDVLPGLVLNGVELKRKLLEDIGKGAIVIYEDLENAILEALDGKKTNSSVVYQTAKNVKSSDIMDYTMVQDANLTSFQSIINNFEEFEMFNKESSSESIIMTAKFRPNISVNSIRESVIPDTKFYFKMYPLQLKYIRGGNPATDTVPSEGLQVELFCYDHLFLLAQHNITPNILCKIATSVLPDLNDFILSNKIDMPEKAKLVKQISDMNDELNGRPNSEWSQTGLIMTQPGGETFYVKFASLTPTQKQKILFQLFYTLYVFEQIEFSHGDLHIKNVFIVDVPETELCYIVNGQQYRFKTTKLLKIYDFDHSIIAKTTNIKINTTEHFVIPRKLNPNRNTGNNLNRRYAETNIFNKNLDILIFVNYLSYIYPNFFNSLTVSNSNALGINDFFRECFPGFDSANPISQEIIQLTYLQLLADDVNREEANRIFGITINKKEDLGHYGLGIGVFTTTWIEYFKKIKDNFGRIVKDITGSVANNNLWIPDTIVIPKREMLAHRYFDSLKSNDPIDIRTIPVYTIDNRIL